MALSRFFPVLALDESDRFMEQPPVGSRFSQVYLDRSAPTSDSDRFRRRIAEAVEAYFDYRNLPALGRMLRAQCGIDVQRSGDHYYVDRVILKGELRDVLDTITVVWQLLDQADKKDWLRFVETAMREENVGYRVDAKGGVHYYIDQEFEQSRTATLAVLQHAALASARAAFDDAFRHLDSADTKAAVRSIFEAAETLAKQICPEAKNLNKWLAENTLKQRCVGVMKPDKTEQRVLEGMFDSLGAWANSLHDYRHGQPGDAPVAPSEELAVHAISCGAANVRLLANCFLRLQGLA